MQYIKNVHNARELYVSVCLNYEESSTFARESFTADFKPRCFIRNISLIGLCFHLELTAINSFSFSLVLRP